MEELEAELFAFQTQHRVEFERLVGAAGDRVVRFEGESGCGGTGCGCSPEGGCGRSGGATRTKDSCGAGIVGLSPATARRRARRRRR